MRTAERCRSGRAKGVACEHLRFSELIRPWPEARVRGGARAGIGAGAPDAVRRRGFADGLVAGREEDRLERRVLRKLCEGDIADDAERACVPDLGVEVGDLAAEGFNSTAALVFGEDCSFRGDVAKQSALAAIIACFAQKKLVPSRMNRPSGSAYHCDRQPKGLSDGSWKRTGLATSASRGCTAASAGCAGVVARDGSPAAAPLSVPIVVLIGDDLAATEGDLLLESSSAARRQELNRKSVPSLKSCVRAMESSRRWAKSLGDRCPWTEGRSHRSCAFRWFEPWK